MDLPSVLTDRVRSALDQASYPELAKLEVTSIREVAGVLERVALGYCDAAEEQRVELDAQALDALALVWLTLRGFKLDDALPGPPPPPPPPPEGV